jgi:hypothetical protein
MRLGCLLERIPPFVSSVMTVCRLTDSKAVYVRTKIICSCSYCANHFLEALGFNGSCASLSEKIQTVNSVTLKIHVRYGVWVHEFALRKAIRREGRNAHCAPPPPPPRFFSFFPLQAHSGTLRAISGENIQFRKSNKIPIQTLMQYRK